MLASTSATLSFSLSQPSSVLSAFVSIASCPQHMYTEVALWPDVLSDALGLRYFVEMQSKVTVSDLSAEDSS